MMYRSKDSFDDLKERPIRKRKKIDYYDEELDSFDLEESEEESINSRQRSRSFNMLPKGFMDGSEITSPSALYYTARPNTQTATWLLQQSPSYVGNVQDYTRTPIPTYSSRLLAKNKEGLMIKQLERSLQSTDPKEYNVALNVLTVKSWNPNFYLAIHSYTLENLYRLFKFIKNRFDKSEGSYIFNAKDEQNNLYQLCKISTILKNFSFSEPNADYLATNYKCIKMITELIKLEGFEQKIKEIREIYQKDQNYNSTYDSKLGSILSTKEDLLISSLVALANIANRIWFLKSKKESAIDLLNDDNSNDSNSYKFLKEYSKESEYLENFAGYLIWVFLKNSNDSIRYLVIEILAKLSSNQNSKPIWDKIKEDHFVSFFLKSIDLAIIDKDIAEWSMLALRNISNFIMNPSIAQKLIKANERLISDMVNLVISNFNIFEQNGPDYVEKSKRFSRELFIAKKTCDILLKFAQIDEVSKHLLIYENNFIDIMLKKGKLEKVTCEILQNLQI